LAEYQPQSQQLRARPPQQRSPSSLRAHTCCNRALILLPWCFSPTILWASVSNTCSVFDTTGLVSVFQTRKANHGVQLGEASPDKLTAPMRQRLQGESANG